MMMRQKMPVSVQPSMRAASSSSMGISLMAWRIIKVPRLLAAGRHLKRGLLLYGPPGTGKTLTAMYLVGRMPGRTVLILSGRSYGLVAPTCELARNLQPSTVILEDVDLVFHTRELNPYGTALG